jgi:hypothetical protein
MKNKENVNMRINNKPIDPNAENRNKVFKTITEQLLDNNVAIGGYLGKKLKGITIDYGILYIMLEENMPLLQRKIPTIDHPIGKVNYIFKVLEDQINRP